MPQITPFLWFNNNAEQAVAFYLSIFKRATRQETVHVPDVEPSQNRPYATIPFEIEGRPYLAFNGGPNFPFTEAISIVVACDTQHEIDYYWSALSADGGKEVQCGWLKDKFGLSWQIVPSNMGELARSAAAMKALMGMKKLDKAALEAAARE